MKLSTTTGVAGKRFGYEETIKLIAQAGFDAYDMDMSEIQFSDCPLSGSDYVAYLKHLKAVADENGIVCNQAHTPFPTQLNGNDAYNQITLDMIIRSMECASSLGADVIVMHPIKNSSSTLAKEKGYGFELFESKKQLYDANIKFFNNLIPFCQKYNIKIAVENMWERHPLHRDTLIPAFLGHYEEHLDFIKDMNSEWIVGCLDIGHSLICGEKPQDAIHHFGAKYLKALHIHDCNGYEDSHVLPYSMKTAWDKILKALADIEYDGYFTFEADKFLVHYPDGFISQALSYMCLLGRFMIAQIER